MSRMCGTCKGTGLLTSLDQLQRSTAPKTVPCHTCRGRGFVEDVIDLAAENERLKAKAKHYVCVRERNRETINDLKGKLNAAESENERLKARLDAVIAECNKPITTTSDVFGGGIASGHNILKRNILAIIDKDGDET